MMLHSGIGQPYDPKTGKGVVGRNYCHQVQSQVGVFFEGKEMNPFMAAGSLGMVIDDFNGDNFDHSGMDFLGGGYIALNSTNARPILTRETAHAEIGNTGDPAQDWQLYGVAETGQLNKANDDKATGFAIINACEVRDEKIRAHIERPSLAKDAAFARSELVGG